MTAATTVTPIDPFTPVVDGVYRDGVVEVRACRDRRPRRGLRTIRTEHFDVVVESRPGGIVGVQHLLDPRDLDDDLGGMLAAELFGPGWLRGADLFERLFTGVVLTSAADATEGWELFYRNTLARLDALLDEGRRGAEQGHDAGGEHDGGPGHGILSGYAPVYGHVESLLAPGTVLELGSCFGFLALRLAAQGRPVVASDISAGTISLLDRIAERLRIPLASIAADAARLPYAPRCTDNVLAVHLLEHLDHDHGDRVVAEAVRLAAHRVVIAVPLEEQADETYGHVRTVSLADLETWGASTGLPFEVHEFSGGWLVIDTV